MIEDCAAIALFNKMPQLDAISLEMRVREMEQNVPMQVQKTAESGGLLVKAGDVRMTVVPYPGSAPDEVVVPCLGMADLARQDIEVLQRHQGHVVLTCEKSARYSSMDDVIVLLKFAVALCDLGACGVCVPASGLSFLARDLREFDQMNRSGPRVWGVEEAEVETNLPAYEKHSLWNSLRREAQPAGLVVGFVPAEVGGSTWFFSAGHSLFGLPEIAYRDGTLDDFQALRELFRFLFSYFYQRPELIVPGQVIKTDDSSLTLLLQTLPSEYSELQSPTGTLLVSVVNDDVADSDWD